VIRREVHRMIRTRLILVLAGATSIAAFVANTWGP
jgi:hypothetical protein